MYDVVHVAEVKSSTRGISLCPADEFVEKFMRNFLHFIVLDVCFSKSLQDLRTKLLTMRLMVSNFVVENNFDMI